MIELKRQLIRDRLLERGIVSMRFEDITKVFTLPLPVAVAYAAVLGIEKLVLTEASNLKQHEELKPLGREYESSFYEVKNKLRKAIENGKDNKMCVDVFRPVYVV